MPFLTVDDGVRLHYREAGEGAPVLLIHGGGATLDAWGECFDRVAGFARAIAYDYRPLGRSEGEPVVGVARHGDDAAAILRTLDAAPATVLGHSFGASIALDLAVRHPAAVCGLVLVEPPLYLGRVPERESIEMLVQMAVRRRLRGDLAAAQWFFDWACEYRSGGSAFAKLPAPLREDCLANATPMLDAAKYNPEALGRHLPKGGISRIACPVTCVVGTETRRGFARTTRRVARAIAQARLVEVPGSSHLVAFDAPDAVVDAAREAVERAASARAA